MPKPKILCVIGTRPEAIKVAPVVQELRKFPEAETVLVSTGQHREMLTQSLDAFGLEPDEDLGIMQHGQTLAQVTARAIEGLDALIAKHEPAFLLAQGDTTPPFVAALNSFYRQVPFGHIEAGLRTETIDNPFPEEFNRRAASLVTTLHFPPTKWAEANLVKEGYAADTIFVTGNTGIDAVIATGNRPGANWFPEWTGRIMLLTTHRRENWGEPQRQIAHAALRLLNDFDDVLLVVPMHKNPDVRATLTGVLGGHPRVRLIEPPDYGDFVPLMKRSFLILSDSGGVQEEAPAFGVPVLVLRDTTERPEGCDAGTAKLVGTDENRIYTEGHVLLNNEHAYRAMAQAVSPYGDGKASERIRYVVLDRLGIPTPEVPMWT
jgi:UDP-N-acetylglucosamine 2-epimerase